MNIIRLLFFSIILLITIVTSAVCFSRKDNFTYNNINLFYKKIYKTVRRVDDFQEISVDDGIKLYLSQNNQKTVSVITSSAYLGEKIKTVTTKDKLRIYFDASDDPNWKGLVHSREEFKVYVTIPILYDVEAADGAQVRIEEVFNNSEKVSFYLASGAKLYGNIKSDFLKIIMRGGSIANVRGKVNQLDIHVTQGSKFKNSKLISKECKAYASGASQVELSVSDSLDANAVNEAVIKYKGKGKLFKSSKQQGGEITRM
ncbi:head GIN domain-containing protein [Hymenobacter psoromatis]|uniref:head GIN domain-containing protein n=1 Tax=Hymenobacter psoromatis TaxID=1484116 RepID=UPI001CC0A01D|nr:head GIN domain-containing protein [Hymenobacter psoromatis]